MKIFMKVFISIVLESSEKSVSLQPLCISSSMVEAQRGYYDSKALCSQ